MEVSPVPQGMHEYLFFLSLTACPHRTAQRVHILIFFFIHSPSLMNSVRSRIYICVVKEKVIIQMVLTKYEMNFPTPHGVHEILY